MYVFYIVVGVVLILFGGGCTIVYMGLEAYGEFLVPWLGLGLAPLAGGFFLIRHGLKFLRERRAEPSSGDKQ